MNGLTDFLLARIAEDERRIIQSLYAGDVMALNPQQMLADCEAKRHLVELFASADEHARQHPDIPILSLTSGAYESALRVLSLPHAGHPDYRDEWKP